MKNFIYLLIIIQFLYINSEKIYISPNNITKIDFRNNYNKEFILLNGTYTLSQQLFVSGKISTANNAIVEFISSSDNCILKVESSNAYLKGPIIFRDSNCGIEIVGQFNVIDGIKIYNMRENGIIIGGNDLKVMNTEIISSGENGIKFLCNSYSEIIKNKISNTKKAFYSNGGSKFLIDSNAIYNCTDAIYLTNEANDISYERIVNNIIVNCDNVISYHNIKSNYKYYYIYIVGNTIFKPKNSVFYFEQYNGGSAKNYLSNNFIYIPNEKSIEINNINNWEISHNYFYNVKTINDNYSKNAIFYKGDIKRIFSNFQGRCNYDTDNGDILPECFRPHKWYRDNILLNKGEMVAYNGNPLPMYDFDGNTRSINPTIGAFEKYVNFDSAISVFIIYCIPEESYKINIYGKIFKKYFGSQFLEFKREYEYGVECMWKYTFNELPKEHFEYNFIIAENKSILKFGKQRKMNLTHLKYLVAKSGGDDGYRIDDYFFHVDKYNNSYVLDFDFERNF